MLQADLLLPIASLPVSMHAANHCNETWLLQNVFVIRKNDSRTRWKVQCVDHDPASAGPTPPPCPCLSLNAASSTRPSRSTLQALPSVLYFIPSSPIISY